jgi:hypothetical protein
MTEYEQPHSSNVKKKLEKSFLVVAKSAEFFVRTMGFPATIGLFRPQEISGSEVTIRLGVDVLSWVLFYQIIQRVEAAGWDKSALMALAIFFLTSKSIAIPVLEHLNNND